MIGVQKTIAKGNIFELVQMPQPDGRVFEKARRAPGVRLIIADKESQKILLTKEYRHELAEWDYRLPGGKVFDTLEEFAAYRASGEDIVEAAEKQAVNEAQQEAGVEIDALELFKKSTLGATVEWDLYVFEATSWQLSVHGQELQEDEVDDIESADFYEYEEVKQMILRGDMQEERIALILLQWLEQQ